MTLEQKAQTLWPNNPAYQQAWIKIVQAIGSKWLLAKDPQPRPRSYA